MEFRIEKLSIFDLDRFVLLIQVNKDAFKMENFVLPDKGHLLKVLSKSGFIVLWPFQTEKQSVV